MATRVWVRGGGLLQYAVYKDGHIEMDIQSFAWAHSGHHAPLPVEPEVLVGMGHMLGWFDRYPWGLTAVHETGNGRVWLLNPKPLPGELENILVYDPTEKHDGG